MPVVYSKLLPLKRFRFEKSRMITFRKTLWSTRFAFHAHYGFVNVGKQLVECVFCGVVCKLFKSDTYDHLEQVLLGAHRKECPSISASKNQFPNVPMIKKKKTCNRQKVFLAKYIWRLQKVDGIQNGFTKKKQKLSKPFPTIFLSEWKRLETFQECEEVLQTIKAARHGLVWVGNNCGQCVFCNKIGKLQKFSFINDNYHTVSCPTIRKTEVGNQPIEYAGYANEVRPILKRTPKIFKNNVILNGKCKCSRVKQQEQSEAQLPRTRLKYDLRARLGRIRIKHNKYNVL